VIEVTTDAGTRQIESKLPCLTKFTSGLTGGSVLTVPGKFTLNGPYFRTHL